MMSVRMPSAMPAHVASRLSRGRTSRPTAPRQVPLRKPRAPPSSTPLASSRWSQGLSRGQAWKRSSALLNSPALTRLQRAPV